jgi:hypothetical protein
MSDNPPDLTMLLKQQKQMLDIDRLRRENRKLKLTLVIALLAGTVTWLALVL